MTEELTKLREALRRVKHEAASLADAQVIALEALTAAQPAQVPDDSALLDHLDTLAKRPAGSDLHCFGGRVVLYVRTDIGAQVEASGAGTAREAIRAAMLTAAQQGAEHE